MHYKHLWRSWEVLSPNKRFVVSSVEWTDHQTRERNRRRKCFVSGQKSGGGSCEQLANSRKNISSFFCDSYCLLASLIARKELSCTSCLSFFYMLFIKCLVACIFLGPSVLCGFCACLLSFTCLSC